MTITLRFATRRSRLAKTQTLWVADAVCRRNPGVDVELVEVVTAGDTDATTSLTQFPEVGVFTTAVQEAVLSGKADVAVHSLKDLPLRQADGLTMAAIPPREDARDVLIAGEARLATLPTAARVGTDSPRRIWQLRRVRPDLEPTQIRGNIDSRMSRVETGEYAAVIIAAAGVRRIGRADAISEYLDFAPAPGQGALAVECRADDASTAAIVGSVADPATRDCVAVERSWLLGTGGGCHTSAAAFARLAVDGSVVLDWFLDGREGRMRARPDQAVEFAASAGRLAVSGLSRS